MLKLCNICGERPRSKNQGTCSPCRWAKHKAKENERRKTPERRQQVNQWKRTRTISTEAKRTDIRCRKRYSQKYPEKEKAKRKLNWEITMGRIIRPELCSVCGKSEHRRDGRSLIQAHHDDYSKPLEVKWLCVQCHKDHHRAMKDQP